MLGRMPWSMPRRHDYFAKCETVAVFDFLRLKTVLCTAFPARVNPGGLKSRAQLARTAHQIGVNVRLKDVCDGDAGFAGSLYVNIAVRARIEHSSNPLVIVADEIRQLCDTFCLNGLKNERHRSDLTRRSDELQPFVRSGGLWPPFDGFRRSQSAATIHRTSTSIGSR